MPAIQTNRGVTLHYGIHGAGRITLMFLHGWGGNGSIWDRVVPHLDATRYQSLSVDLRGHGQSGCPRSGYTWEDFERDVLGVADQEQAWRFIPVGFSTGGKLACYL